MDNYEKLLAHPAVENCHPKFIAVVDGKKEFVAEVIDGTVYLTEAGKKLFAADEAKPARKSRKVAEPVEAEPDVLDDLDLGV